jgi:hypothetical protein
MKEFSAVSETGIFIVEFQRPVSGPCSEPLVSSPQLRILLSNIYFNFVPQNAVLMLRALKVSGSLFDPKAGCYGRF